jgi:outer membrane protein OmpA-like peptidoglycan-associated protein
VLIKNNILSKNKQYGVFIAPDAKKTRIIYNNINKNRRPYNPDAVVNETNIDKEPLYINPKHPVYNYFVKDASACKGRGEGGTDIGLITEKMEQVLSTDRDGDGLLDDIDQCPDDPEDKDGFEDEDGCPDFDNDGDGISDVNDQCPDTPEDIDDFQDMDGCPDTDNDKDGILDVDDNCPNKPETVNGYKDNDGCPDEKPMEIKQTLILKGVNFKTASAELLEESYYVLETVYNSLEAYPHIRVEIAGHTDNQGSDNYNLALSYDRAKTVMNYLIMRGIPKDRLVARGYGETRPIATNDTEEGRYENRRVEVIPLK